MTSPIVSSFARWFEADGTALDNGFIYFGQVDLDPQSVPIVVYWDAAFSIPAQQPLRTLAGVIVRNGSPADVYIPSAYSERVQDKNGVTIYTKLRVDQLLDATGADQVGYQYSAPSIVRNVGDRLREATSALDRAAGDGVTDDTTALNAWAAENAGKLLRLPQNRVFKITDTLLIPRCTGLDMEYGMAQVLYAGPTDRPAIQVGIPGQPNSNQWGNQPVLRGINVLFKVNPLAADLTEVDFAGIRIHNLDWSDDLTIANIIGFSRGLDLVGDVFYGFSYCNFSLGRLVNNKEHIVIRSNGATLNDGFVNQLNFRGGGIQNNSAYPALLAATGVLMTWNKVASYRGSNNHKFDNTSFEIGETGGLGNRIPIIFDGAGSQNAFRDIRLESYDGPACLADGGAPLPGDVSYVVNNDIHASYSQSANADIPAVQQINGAIGNRYSDKMSQNREPILLQPAALSGSVKVGSASAIYLSNEWLGFTSWGITPSKQLASANLRLTPDWLELSSSEAVGVAIDTTERKEMTVRVRAVSGFAGRLVLRCFDRWGVQLTSASAGVDLLAAADTIAARGTSFPYEAGFGGSFRTQADETIARPLSFRVTDIVKSIIIAVTGGSQPARIKGMQISCVTSGDIFSVDATSFYRMLDLSDESYADVKPDTVGQFGIYRRGELAGNALAAVGATVGWAATTGGWNAPAWTIATAYTADTVRYNGTEVYICTIGGTSAGAGGPSGTGTAIIDGTVTWRWIATRAIFGTRPNLA